MKDWMATYHIDSRLIDKSVVRIAVIIIQWVQSNHRIEDCKMAKRPHSLLPSMHHLISCNLLLFNKKVQRSRRYIRYQQLQPRLATSRTPKIHPAFLKSTKSDKKLLLTNLLRNTVIHHRSLVVLLRMTLKSSRANMPLKIPNPACKKMASRSKAIFRFWRPIQC